MTNCVNCGAPLHGNKCEYCGTEYGNLISEKAMALLEFSSRGIKPETAMKVLGLMYETELYRDCNGILHRPNNS